MDKKQRYFSTWYLLLALFIAWIFNDMLYKPHILREKEVTYNVFVQHLNEGKVDEVVLSGDRIIFTLKGADETKNIANVVPVNDPALINRLVAAGVTFSAQAQTKSLLATLLGWFLPLLPLVLI
jgi:cell division protease FtsH